MDEFDLTRELQKLLLTAADARTVTRILHYLTDWNKSRPLPAAKEL